jgi:hypothetical protein
MDEKKAARLEAVIAWTGYSVAFLGLLVLILKLLSS